MNAPKAILTLLFAQFLTACLTNSHRSSPHSEGDGQQMVRLEHLRLVCEPEKSGDDRYVLALDDQYMFILKDRDNKGDPYRLRMSFKVTTEENKDEMRVEGKEQGMTLELKKDKSNWSGKMKMKNLGFDLKYDVKCKDKDQIDITVF